MIEAIEISSSAIKAQRTRLDIIAGNIANAEATRQEDGRLVPYRRRFAQFIAGDGQGGAGVHVARVLEDPTPFRQRFDPGHPDAGPDGYLRLPNVNITMEYVDAMEASRAYEANLAMMNVSKAMLRETIQLFA
jgi:flagellar basal-body rod protein FlgC